MKRTIILVSILLVVLLAAGGGFLWYRRNTGSRLLTRSRLALKASNPGKAKALAGKYVQQNPSHWQGYHLTAEACAMEGDFVQAHRELDQAAKVAPAETAIPFMRAGLLAREAEKRHATRDYSGYVAAIDLLFQSRDVLAKVKLPEGASTLELDTRMGFCYKQLAIAYANMSQTLSKQADTEKARHARRWMEDHWARAIEAALERTAKGDLDASSVTGAIRGLLGFDSNVPDLDAGQVEQLARITQGIAGSSHADVGFARQALVAASRAELARVFRSAEANGESVTLADLADATELCQRVLAEEADPRHPGALDTRSRLAMIQRNVAFRQAKEIFLKVSLLDPSAETAVTEAVKLCQELDDVQSLKAIRKALTPVADAPLEPALLLIEEDLRSVLTRYVSGPVQREHLKPILAMVERLGSKYRDDLRVKLVQADLALRLGEYEQVERLCDAVLSGEKSDQVTGFAELLRSKALAADHGAAKAEAELYKLTAEYPNSPEAQYAYAMAMMELGKGQQAKDAYQLLQRRNQDKALTLVFSRQGLYLQSIDAMLDQAQLAIRLDDPASAVDICNNVRRAMPNHARAAVLRAWALSQSNPNVPAALMSFVLAANGSDYQEQAQAQLAVFGKQIEAAVAEAASKADVAGRRAEAVGMNSLAEMAGKLNDPALADGQRRQIEDAFNLSRQALNAYGRCMAMMRMAYNAHTVMGNVDGADAVVRQMIGMPRFDRAERLVIAQALGAVGRSDAAEAVLAAELQGPQADVDGRLRLTMANMFAGRGKIDDAIALLDGMAAEDALRDVALLAKANILARADRLDQAGEAIAMLDAERRPQRAQLLVRVAEFYARANQGDKLVAAVEALVANLADNVDLTSRVLGLIERVSPPAKAQQLCMDAAVAIRNTRNVAVVYKTLAELRDAQQDRVGALAALDDLRNLPASDEIADIYRAEAMFHEGRLLARWGLYAPAIERLETLAQSGQQGIPRGLLALGQALASHGRTDQAKEVLGRIGRDATEFKQAQLELVNLIEKDEAKLAAFGKMSHYWPADESILYRMMNLLVRMNRSQEAVDSYSEFVRRLGDTYRPVTGAPPLALMLMTEQGDGAAAAAEAVRLARGTQANSWRVAAALLNSSTNPATAKALLEDAWKRQGDVPGGAALLVACAGLATAVESDDSVLADEWAKRLRTIEASLAEMSPALLDTMVAQRLLAAMADGQVERAGNLLAKVADVQGFGATPAKALVAMADGPDRRRMAAGLLSASIARQVQMPWLAYAKAMDLLCSRGECQWAAAIAYRSVGNDGMRARRLERLGRAMDDDEFGSNVVSEVARALELVVAGQDADAAAVYANLADTFGDSNHRLEQAMALERAGRTDEALALYETLWRDNPVAANNLAFRLLANGDADQEQLARAAERAEAAVAMRAEPAFCDTLGWIAFQLGQYEKAVWELTLAVRGLPREPAIHYHLGMAEAAAGNVQLAKWHFQASVNIGETADADHVALDKDSVHAIAHAKAELARLEGQM